MSETRLLVSVRTAEEASLALQGGAAVIDIKEPSRGALGRADLHTMHAIAHIVGKRAAISVAMGDLHELEQCEPGFNATSLPANIAFMKIGLAGEAASDTHWRRRLAVMFARFPKVIAVPVAYWDAPGVLSPSPDEVLDWAIEHEATMVLIDTADKHGPGLLSLAEDQPRLALLLEKAGVHKINIALAGKLVGASFDAAVAMTRTHEAAVILGVRSAACHENLREGSLCPDAVRRLTERLKHPV